MRSLTPPLQDIVGELAAHLGLKTARTKLEGLCQVELGLHLQSKLMPGTPAAHAWVLFSGYGFAEAYGVRLPPDGEKMLRVARYSLWTLRRGRAWREALEEYQRYAPLLRGFDVQDSGRAATRQEISVAASRWRCYDRLLRVAPPLAGRPRPVAQHGPHGFPISRSMAVVDLPEVAAGPLTAHDVDMLPAGDGAPLRFRMRDLERTAAEMDSLHREEDPQRRPRWLKRLKDFTMSVRKDDSFAPSREFTVDGVQHLLGIVGAGKSTLRDVIAVHLAKRGLRTTVVVSDVPDVLKLVQMYNLYTQGAAAPVIGSSNREQHAQRLHRRLAGRGEHRLLAHDDPSFAFLGTSCVLNLHRRSGPVAEPLAFGEAPCSRLRKPADPKPRSARTPEWQRDLLSCPYWSVCPRHHGSRALVRAAIWVATPAGLVDASPPQAQNAQRIRYLELACRRSDLVIIDEADRVQMQLDTVFAPAVLLAGDEERGFIDVLSRHKIRELAASGRTQLSERDVENFTAALNTAGTATDRLYAMLVASDKLREWVRVGYFSAWTLQLGLLDERYPVPEEGTSAVPLHAEREALGKLLDAFRDNPLGDRPRAAEVEFGRLTALLYEILHTGNPDATRQILAEAVTDIFRIDEKFLAGKQEEYERERVKWECKKEKRQRGKKSGSAKAPDPPETPDEWYKELVKRFEFTLLLSALEPRLAMINAMWPRVQSALSLGYNEMYRRPLDYGPMVPEAPMGNVLGFQFRVHGKDEGGVRSGELTFFRCSGVGRELLRALPHLASVDARPGAHLLLMSGSSWAGKSSRYHLREPVGVIIEPPARLTERIAEESTMRFEFIDDGDERLRISGSDVEERPEKMRRIASWLGAGVNEAEDGGPLERELLDLPPGRDQILLLVGSYVEARLVADTLHNLNSRWRDRVLCLISDDEEIDEDDLAPSAYRARSLRRGDVEHLKDARADVLVAPLLAVERGHNILNEDAEAAIGTVYFLARPNPHPDDLSLAVHAVNDWIVRALDNGDFASWVRKGSTVEEGAEEVRSMARSRWHELLQRPMAWSRLGDDREQVTWDMLVLMWQVIGRLVRGGVPARVVFVDAAFAPHRASNPPRPDTPRSSLLHSVLDVLDPYLVNDNEPADHRFIVRALYEPLWRMLSRCLAQPPSAPDDFRTT
ncbi:hypothetical protein HA039_25120 [Streptomyces liangshanensis]|uniref:pPIWI-RE three-gene island domain-containing protein n=2 Tax=Streptomyces liangshanensis TaxID=2717324 RepID=A0A6G9HA89_9ACTN|nr:hypothetical protein HA039_25120 [Streptomyces liangshanensis]